MLHVLWSVTCYMYCGLGHVIVHCTTCDRFMMVAVGLPSFVAQTMLTVAVQLEHAGKVSLMRKSGDILFSFLFQILIFNVSYISIPPARFSKPNLVNAV